MIKKIKTLILSSITLLALLTPTVAVASLAPALVSANACTDTTSIQTGLNCGTCLSVSDPNCDAGANAESKVQSTIKLVINILSLVVGVVAVIMIIFGGLKYILSAGDSGSVSSAKNTILYAIVGLVIVALAQFIVRFVLAKVAG